MKLSLFSQKITRILKYRNQVLLNKKSRKGKCLFKDLKFIRIIKNKTSLTIKDSEKVHLTMDREINKGQEPEKTLKIKTGILGKIMNSIYNKCILCITIK